MSLQMILMFIAIFALFVMQGLGGYFQIKRYKTAIRRVHKKGNVGIGQRRGKFFNGHLVLVACDKNGTITGGEVLDGITFFAKFRPLEKILDKPVLGESIYHFLDEFNSFDKKRQKRYQGYIRALDALRIRLINEAAERELELEERGGAAD